MLMGSEDPTVVEKGHLPWNTEAMKSRRQEAWVPFALAPKSSWYS